MPPPASPRSTYRLQFNHRFTFSRASEVVPYLARLGVSDVYASPYLMAQPGSLHGYDICDHTRLNPEVGGDADYERFVQALREHGLGQVLDFVPNHMGIDPAANSWWRDVLENGQSSAYAHFFDIDWDPVKPELKGKVLLPILGDQYGLVLERGELRIAFEGGGLALYYFEHQLPVNPRSAVEVYECGLDTLEGAGSDEDPDVRELLSIMTSLRNLPPMSDTEPARIAERRREKEVARERLERLVERSPRVSEHIRTAVNVFNGTPGNGTSFNLLHALLERQAYRLAYWRTASHEINYRRFFDINTLAALRMEDREVFDATHALVKRFLATGAVTGLRIDHPDGLFDPAEYFERLQELWRSVKDGRLGEAALPLRKEAAPPLPGEAALASPDAGPGRLYVLAEKILSPGEDLPREWPIAGTTGYQFANDVNGVLLDQAGERPLRQFYARYTKHGAPFAEVVYESKRFIARSSLASELNVLAHALNRISESNRRSRDFTLESLRSLLQEVVACFPVYRTYVTRSGWSAADRDRIETAVMRARWRSPATEGSIFDFFREVVLPRQEEALPSSPATGPAGGDAERRDGYAPSDEEDYQRRLVFSMKLQQYTAPVQAKGLEDTSFYRYNPLVSLNEVGGAPARFGRTIAEFHEQNLARLERWPLEMTSTATHDTKVGEDVRARISVLSQIPAEWRKQVARWTRINTAHRVTVRGEPAPERNDEYRFYQILVGVWPAAGGPPDERLVSRLRDYMMKAIKEAKVHTSWVNDNEAYDRATAGFVERALAGQASARFLASFLPFQRRVAHLALSNSLSQLLLKIASPGVPDFYQGNELWDLRLVDPDNRTDVDFGERASLLDAIEPMLPVRPDGTVSMADSREALRDTLEHWQDGRLKLWVTACGLRLRRARPELFVLGEYTPLEAAGTQAEVVSFARSGDRGSVIAVAPRLLARLGSDWKEWEAAWGGASLALPEALRGRRWVNVLTGQAVDTEQQEAGEAIPLARLLSPCPVGLLVSR